MRRLKCIWSVHKHGVAQRKNNTSWCIFDHEIKPAGPVQSIRDKHFVTTMLADVPAHDGVRPLAGTLLTTFFRGFFKLLMSPCYSSGSDDVIQNGWRDLAESHDTSVDNILWCVSDHEIIFNCQKSIIQSGLITECPITFFRGLAILDLFHVIFWRHRDVGYALRSPPGVSMKCDPRSSEINKNILLWCYLF